MNYLDNQIEKNSSYKAFMAQIDNEVVDFFENFEDSPEKTSRWGHHYFCKHEGGRFIYNDKEPHKHVCSVCGKVTIDKDMDACWVTMYRNQGVVSAWKAAFLYSQTRDKKYLDYVISFTDFYSNNYLKFTIHNKEGLEFESLDNVKWGVSRIMPQSLNEAIFIIRLINALEIVKSDLPEGYIAGLEKKLFNEVFVMLKPQVHKVHNIPTWLNSCIAVMGYFLNNQEMIDYAHTCEFNIERQLVEGVTKDKFWYEGSIHYNYFLLEGVVQMLLFSELYGKPFAKGKEIVEAMLKAGYKYAFDNHLLPNPNDGWPDVNLKTYSYIYATATKVFGADSEIGKILGAILNKDVERGQIPLSKPYYYNNDISLEELLFTPTLRETHTEIIKTETINFPSSYCGLIKSDDSNVFVKYGHNGPSHAHPDKMNIEVILGEDILSRELSNTGYGNQLCNEWHRKSPSHNTVVVDGKCHTSFEGGEVLNLTSDRLKCESKGVYEGVDYIRDIKLENGAFSDKFDVTSGEEHTFDYFFHIEAELLTELKTEGSCLGYTEEGYQHLHNVRKVITDDNSVTIDWKLGINTITSTIDIDKSELFVCTSPDNSDQGYRNTIIIRQQGSSATYNASWKK